MSAGQELLLRRHLTERLVPLVSAWVPLFGPMTGCLWSRDRRSATVTANLPDHTFTIATNCKRDGQKNPDANTVFWLHLTIFRMNTCAKRVGGWGRLAQPILRQRSSLRLCCHHEGRPQGKACLARKRSPARGICSWHFPMPHPFYPERRRVYPACPEPRREPRFDGPTPGRRAIAPPAWLRYSAAQGSGDNF
jgi:hypothetical protein